MSRAPALVLRSDAELARVLEWVNQTRATSCLHDRGLIDRDRSRSAAEPGSAGVRPSRRGQVPTPRG